MLLAVPYSSVFAKARIPATARKALHRRIQCLQELPLSKTGASCAFAAASASRKSWASLDHRPPTSIAVTTRRHLVPRSSGYRFSFLFRASASAAPFSQLARGRGSPFLFKGLTKVVSTASWAPLCSESPVTTHSNYLSSVGATPPRLKSLR